MQNWTVPGPDAHLLSRKEVLSYLKIGTRALNRLIEAGVFPRGINVAGGKKGAFWSGLDLACYLHLRSRLRAGPIESDENDEEEEEFEPESK